MQIFPLTNFFFYGHRKHNKLTFDINPETVPVAAVWVQRLIKADVTATLHRLGTLLVENFQKLASSRKFVSLPSIVTLSPVVRSTIYIFEGEEDLNKVIRGSGKGEI